MNANEVLRKHNIRKTAIREKVLDLLIRNNECLSYAAIEQKIEDKTQKGSILRVLNYFLSRGIVKKIMIDGIKLRYYFSEKEKKHIVYFRCTCCGDSYLFESKFIEPFAVQGMEVSTSHISAKGICPKCNQ